MIALLWMACQEPTTVQPLVDARADEIVMVAAPGIRLAVAAGSLGAWLCSLNQTDLRELGQAPDSGTARPSITAPPDVAANLAVLDDGEFFYNSETGVASMTFTGSLDSHQALTVEVEVDTPTREFTVTYRDPEGSAYTGTAEVDVEDCAATPRVSVDLDLDDGMIEFRIVLPDSEGELLEWNAGQFAPRTGTASWSTGSGVERMAWVADDAADMDGKSWPGTAASADWQTTATVSIARPD